MAGNETWLLASSMFNCIARTSAALGQLSQKPRRHLGTLATYAAAPTASADATGRPGGCCARALRR
jgi:hypothetical protein